MKKMKIKLTLALASAFVLTACSTQIVMLDFQEQAVLGINWVQQSW